MPKYCKIKTTVQSNRKRWPSFASGAYRKDPKKKGALRKQFSGLISRGVAENAQESYGWGSGRTEPEQLRLTYEGRKKLEEFRKKQELRVNAKTRREKHSYLKWLLKDSIKFTTNDGTVIKIMKQGWLNVYGEKSSLGKKPIHPRALVLCFVDGKKLFFYKSSGEASKMPGEWFPTFGPEGDPVYDDKFRVIGKQAGWMTKLEGHPSGKDGIPQSFPPWVVEIQAKLKEAENEKRIQFQPSWKFQSFEILNELFGKIPFTDKIK